MPAKTKTTAKTNNTLHVIRTHIRKLREEHEAFGAVISHLEDLATRLASTQPAPATKPTRSAAPRRKTSTKPVARRKSKASRARR